MDPDIEIELEVALAVLRAAAPPEPDAKSNGTGSGDSSDWYTLVNGIVPPGARPILKRFGISLAASKRCDRFRKACRAIAGTDPHLL